MRLTTLISFLATSLALLSQSPAVYAAPIPSQLISAGEKRGCAWSGCRIAEPGSTPTNSATTPQTTPQTPTVLNLVDAMINALDAYRQQYTTSGPPTAADFIIPPNPAGEPTDNTPTTDGSPAVAAVDTIELAGDSL